MTQSLLFTGYERDQQPNWVSKETKQKEEHFAGLVSMVAGAAKGAMSRERFPEPFLFIDLHGGPGRLRFGGQEFDGSPLIARRILSSLGLDFTAVHFEMDPETAAVLSDRVSDGVVCDRHEDGLPVLLAELPRSDRFGLAYSDPVNTPIPVESLNLLADYFPRLDLLAYVAANSQYKRPNSSGHGHGRELRDDVFAIRKKYSLIRRGHGPHEWTFVFWSNWRPKSAWEKEGFYRTDEPEGRAILDHLNEVHGRVR